MRHNQNGRRFRGRGNNGGGQNGGGGHSGNHQQNGGNNNGFRRVNRGTQTFDSNGPDVRIRGNAYQINEKYAALAKDAASAGDRILAESYLQHAEHYQRMINEIAEEMGKYQQQFQQQEGAAAPAGEEAAPADAVVTSVAQPGAEQPSDEGLNDIGFLRTPARGNVKEAAAEGEEAQQQPEQKAEKPQRQPRQRQTEQV